MRTLSSPRFISYGLAHVGLTYVFAPSPFLARMGWDQNGINTRLIRQFGAIRRECREKIALWGKRSAARGQLSLILAARCHHELDGCFFMKNPDWNEGHCQSLPALLFRTLRTLAHSRTEDAKYHGSNLNYKLDKKKFRLWCIWGLHVLELRDFHIFGGALQRLCFWVLPGILEWKVLRHFRSRIRFGKVLILLESEANLERRDAAPVAPSLASNYRHEMSRFAPNFLEGWGLTQIF